MKNKKNISDNNSFENSDLFQSLKKDNSFYVPDNYFESLYESIGKKCASKRINTIRIVQNYFLLRPSFSIAMGILVLFFAFGLYFILEKNKNTIQLVATEKLSEKSIEDYLIENENIDDTFIIDAISDDSTNNESIFIDNKSVANGSTQVKEVENIMNTNIDTTLSKEEIINYLFEENIDPNDL